MSELQILDKVGVIVVLFVFVRRLDEQIARFPRFPRLIQMEKREGGRFQKISGKRSHTNDTSTTAAATTLFSLFGGTFLSVWSGHPKNQKGGDLPRRWFPSFFLMKKKEKKIPASNGGGGIIWYLCDYPVTHCVAPQLNKYYCRPDLTLDQRKPRW